MCSFACSLAHSDPVIYINIGFHGIQRFMSACSLALMSQSVICRLSCSLAHSAQNMQVYISLLARSLKPAIYVFIFLLARSFRSSYLCKYWLSWNTKVYISLLVWANLTYADYPACSLIQPRICRCISACLLARSIQLGIYSFACSLAHSDPVIHVEIGFHWVQRFISACSLAHFSWDKLVYFCMLACSSGPIWHYAC